MSATPETIHSIREVGHFPTMPGPELGALVNSNAGIKDFDSHPVFTKSTNPNLRIHETENITLGTVRELDSTPYCNMDIQSKLLSHEVDEHGRKEVGEFLRLMTRDDDEYNPKHDSHTLYLIRPDEKKTAHDLLAVRKLDGEFHTLPLVMVKKALGMRERISVGENITPNEFMMIFETMTVDKKPVTIDSWAYESTTRQEFIKTHKIELDMDFPDNVISLNIHDDGYPIDEMTRINKFFTGWGCWGNARPAKERVLFYRQGNTPQEDVFLYRMADNSYEQITRDNFSGVLGLRFPIFRPDKVNGQEHKLLQLLNRLSIEKGPTAKFESLVAIVPEPEYPDLHKPFTIHRRYDRLQAPEIERANKWVEEMTSSKEESPMLTYIRSTTNQKKEDRLACIDTSGHTTAYLTVDEFVKLFGIHRETWSYSNNPEWKHELITMMRNMNIDGNTIRNDAHFLFYHNERENPTYTMDISRWDQGKWGTKNLQLMAEMMEHGSISSIEIITRGSSFDSMKIKSKDEKPLPSMVQRLRQHSDFRIRERRQTSLHSAWDL